MSETNWQSGIECRERGSSPSMGTLHVTGDELVYVRGGAARSSWLYSSFIIEGLLMTLLVPGTVIGGSSGNYYVDGFDLPIALLASLGPLLLIVGLVLRARDRRFRRKALLELDRSDDGQGMDLEQRYAVTPGSWRHPLGSLERVRRSSDGVRITTSLGDRLRVKTGDPEGLVQALGGVRR